MVNGRTEKELIEFCKSVANHRRRIKTDPLNPSPTLLIKLGSIIVHQEEMMSSKGHSYDKIALDTIRNDPEVIDWFAAMNKMAFLPIKR